MSLIHLIASLKFRDFEKFENIFLDIENYVYYVFFIFADNKLTICIISLTICHVFREELFSLIVILSNSSLPTLSIKKSYTMIKFRK